MSRPEPPHPEHFDTFVGTEYLEVEPDRARARIPVSTRVIQPYGLVHGGVVAALAESLCSRTTAEHVWEEGKLAVGLSNAASFIRPITEGHVNATASLRHRGSTTWVWDVEITDDEGRLCSLVRVTIAVRDRGTP